MNPLPVTSQITFLYFDDMPGARRFFGDILRLEAVHDTGWSCIWRTAATSFVGAVDATQGSIEVTARGGVLISLNVTDLDGCHARIAEAGLPGLTPIKQVKDLALRSFFFTGPEGYPFEIQQFTDGALSALF